MGACVRCRGCASVCVCMCVGVLQYIVWSVSPLLGFWPYSASVYFSKGVCVQRMRSRSERPLGAAGNGRATGRRRPHDVGVGRMPSGMACIYRSYVGLALSPLLDSLTVPFACKSITVCTKESNSPVRTSVATLQRVRGCRLRSAGLVLASLPCQSETLCA